MTTARSKETSVSDVAVVAFERRRRSAWLDYLRIIRDAERSEYEHVEQNAWAQLERRLRRNEELLSEQR